MLTNLRYLMLTRAPLVTAWAGRAVGQVRQLVLSCCQAKCYRFLGCRHSAISSLRPIYVPSSGLQRMAARLADMLILRVFEIE